MKPNKTPKGSSGRVRLNLEFPQRTYDQMLEVQKRTEAASITEVMRRSIAVYDLLTQHIQSGGEIELITNRGTKEKLLIL
jgi:hypothetical protein